MNTRFALPILLAIVGITFLAGGCVPQSRYDEVYASNQRAQEQLKADQAALQNLQGENSRLQGENSRLQTELAAERKLTEGLKGQLATLQGELDKLRSEYEKLANRPAPTLPEGAPALPEELDRVLTQLVDKYPDLLEYDRAKGMVKFKSDLTFAKGSAEVTPRAQEALKKFAEILNLDVAKPYHVYVAGHTDDLPIKSAATREMHPDNWYLSVHRAVSVEQVLAKNSVEQSRIGAMGFGEWHPVAPNAEGHKGNEKNRRVELWIVPPSRFLTLTTVQGGEVNEAKTTPAKATEKKADKKADKKATDKKATDSELPPPPAAPVEEK